MAFVTRPRTMRSLASLCCFATVAGAALLTGCGGGGGGGGNNGGNNPPPTQQSVTVTGKVINQSTRVGVGNIAVSYAGRTARTDSTGTFRFGLTTPVSAGKILFPGLNDSGAWFARAFYRTSATAAAQSKNMETEGVDIPAITTGGTQNVGQFELFSQVGPPPPPP